MRNGQTIRVMSVSDERHRFLWQAELEIWCDRLYLRCRVCSFPRSRQNSGGGLPGGQPRHTPGRSLDGANHHGDSYPNRFHSGSDHSVGLSLHRSRPGLSDIGSRQLVGDLSGGAALAGNALEGWTSPKNYMNLTV